MRLPDVELYGLLKRYQEGDAESGWKFIESPKIKAIIEGRLRKLAAMYSWLPTDDFEDVGCSLRPRLLEIARKFKLPAMRNDGRIISYFTLRVKGEADFLLSKISGMKQVVDKKSNNTFYKTLAQTLDGLEETLDTGEVIDDDVIGCIEDQRQGGILNDMIASIPSTSNDRIWYRCYLLRLSGKTWAQISKLIGYKRTDHTYLKDNTARFVTRLKDTLIKMGENISFRICGIYNDDSEVAIYVYDSSNRKKCQVWSKSYEDYPDLDRIEAKIGDIFRQHEITYVVINDSDRESRASIIIMRYLTKKEAFVEFIPLGQFMQLLPRMPDNVNGVNVNQFHRKAILLVHIKRALLEFGKSTRTDSSCS